MHQISYYKQYIGLLRSIMSGEMDARVASLELKDLNDIARKIDPSKANEYIMKTIPVFATSESIKSTEIKEGNNWQSSSDLCPWQNSGC